MTDREELNPEATIAERSAGSAAGSNAGMLGWGLAGAAATLVVAPLEPNWLEEGIVVHIAERLAAGDTLYSDVLIHTGPLPYELLGLFFRVFGAHLEIVRALVALLHGIATGAAFAIARRAGAGSAAHAATAAVALSPILLFPMLSLYYYTNLGFDLGLLAVAAAVRGVESRHHAAVAGVLISCVALCKQSMGVVLAAGMIPIFFALAESGLRTRQVASLLTGAAGTAAGVLGIYWLLGLLPDFIYSQIGLPLAMSAADSFQPLMMNLWPPGVMSKEILPVWIFYLPNLYHLWAGMFPTISPVAIAATQLLYALPLIALAATVIRAIFGRVDAALSIHAIFLFTMTTNLVPKGDWGHLVVALPPAVFQLVVIGSRLLPSQARRRVSLSTITLLVAVSTIIAVWLWDLSQPTNFGPRIPLRSVSAANQQSAMPTVIHYLRTHTRPGDEVLIPRAEPLLFFATETRNPTPYAGAFPGMGEMLEPGLLPALERVEYVVMSDIDNPGFRFGDELPRVAEYLERHFSVPFDFPVTEASWIVVLRRTADRGKTHIDLANETVDRRFWVRGREDEIETWTRPVPEAPVRLLNRPVAIPLGSRGGGIDFEIDVPPGATFQAGVGLHRLTTADGPIGHRGGLSLAVSVDDGDRVVRLDSISVQPERARISWTSFEVDLRAFDGKRVMLRLEATSRFQRSTAGEFTWVGSPRIVSSRWPAGTVSD